MRKAILLLFAVLVLLMVLRPFVDVLIGELGLAVGRIHSWFLSQPQTMSAYGVWFGATVTAVLAVMRMIKRKKEE